MKPLLVALEQLKSQQYEGVLLDIQVPAVDGYATARHIRAPFASALSLVNKLEAALSDLGGDNA